MINDPTTTLPIETETGDLDRITITEAAITTEAALTTEAATSTEVDLALDTPAKVITITINNQAQEDINIPVLLTILTIEMLDLD